jgi:signal transduction histidine kinase
MAWRRLLRAAVLAAGWLVLALTAARADVLDLNYARAMLLPEGRAAQTADVTLPYHWDREQRYSAGEAIFDVPFSLPSQPTQPYGIYFQRIGSTAEISLNGTILTRLGDVRRPNTDDFAKGPQYVSVPPRLLGRDNVLRVHLRADGGRRGGLSALAIGPEDEVRELYVDNFRWRVSASMVVTIFSLLVGAVALALWVTQTEPGTVQFGRRDSIYLAAGLAEICWALRVADVAIEQPPLPWPVWGVVVTAAFGGWFCGIALFCHHVAGWHRHRSMPWVSTGCGRCLARPSWRPRCLSCLNKPIYLTAWLGSANVLFIIYAAVYLVGAVRRPEPARLLVAAAGALNVAMGVRDWIAIRLSGSLADSTWIRYSSILFGLVLGYIVITRFRAASGQAHDLMANLASRVSEKEAALQQSYARVEQLAREQERTSERARILRDMHDGVGSHISSAIRQLQSGKASNAQVLQTLRDSLDQLKLQIDSMNLPPGDVTALLANLRYRLEPRFAASDIELQWDVDLIAPVQRLDAHAMRQLQFMVFEALSNVLQHAQASVLRIEAGVMGGTVQLRVIDNGAALTPAVPLRRAC